MSNDPILNYLTDAKHAYNKKGSYTESLQTIQAVSSWTKEKNLTGRFWVSIADMANAPILDYLRDAEHAYNKKGS